MKRFSKLSRKQKENLCREKMTELQVWWGNPIEADDWDFIKEMDDKDLEAEIENASGQLRFENFWSRVSKFFKFAIAIFILLGVTGLLLFGIRQLF